MLKHIIKEVINKSTTPQEILDEIEEIKRTGKSYYELQYGNLKNFPMEILELTHITSLGIVDQGFTTIPEDIVKLHNLEGLYIADSAIRSLPESLGQLSLLKEISIARADLRELPESIGNLIRLEDLSIVETYLESLPESLGNCKNLTELNLDENNLQKLHSSIGNNTNLNSISLHDNPIDELPESIGNLQKLYDLNISSTNIRTLPKSFYKLKLDYFDFEDIDGNVINQNTGKKGVLLGKDVFTPDQSMHGGSAEDYVYIDEFKNNISYEDGDKNLLIAPEDLIDIQNEDLFRVDTNTVLRLKQQKEEDQYWLRDYIEYTHPIEYLPLATNNSKSFYVSPTPLYLYKHSNQYIPVNMDYFDDDVDMMLRDFANNEDTQTGIPIYDIAEAFIDNMGLPSQLSIEDFYQKHGEYPPNVFFF